MKVHGYLSAAVFAVSMGLGMEAQAQTSSTPPVIAVWYGARQTFGQQGNPQRYINILGNVSDPDGMASLVYSLNGGPDSTLSIGGDGRRLAQAGDFNIDIRTTELLGGSNQVAIKATDRAGQQTVQTVVVEYFTGRVWPQPYSINWSSVANIQDVAQVMDGLWRVEGGAIRTAIPAYDRLVSVGDTLWTDYEVTVPITIHSVNYQSGATLGILMRWVGYTDDPVSGWQPKSGWNPFGVIGGWRWPYSPSARLELNGTGAGRDFTPALGVRYILKMRVETAANESGLYSLKAWEEGQPEPAGWDLQGSSSTTLKGSFHLFAHYADVSFGTVTVTSLASPPDGTPPSAPTGLTATAVSASQIDLSWTAASDPESGVASYKVYRNGTVVATPTGTSFSDTGLSGGTTYNYEVSAVNGAGLEGPKSTSATATTPPASDTTPPTAPTGLTATAVSASQIDLNWTAASDPESGVASYKVYRNGTVVGTPTGTSFSDTGLSGGTSYTYQVSAVNGAGLEGPKSTSASATTPPAPDTTPPSAPTGLTATAVSASQIDLSWTAASDPESGVASYKVYRNGTVVATPTDTSFSDTGLSGSTSYTYQVSAVNGAGLEGPKSTSASATTPPAPDTTPPSAPTGLTATAVSASQIDLSWTAASDPESGVASYKVYRNGTVVATPTGTSFSDTGLAGSTSYTYQVSAVNGAGLEGPKSASASTTTPDGTPPTAPANLRAQVYGLLQTWRVDLTWTAASDPESGVASYKVYRNGTVIGTATGTTFSDPNVMPLATYSYRVSAVNRVNMEGPQSNTATVQIPLLKPALSGALPFELRQNHPNPFNPSTTIRYALPEAARVRLAVYNALGQQVRVLVDAEQEPGAHSAVWDGRDDSGRAVSAGLYLYRLEAGPRQVIRKMLLAR